jgi:ribosomal protein S18 acetylase RimI-like enzyme
MTQRPPIDVRPAAQADRGTAAGILARAFIDDPALAHLFRDAADRPRRLARFFGLIVSIDRTPEYWTLASDADGDVVAAALWRPPGAWKTPASAMAANILPLLQVFGWVLPRALSMQGAIEAHHPAAPHWYLQFVGCVPQAHGRGFGGAVIRARLAQCDADGLPAALETATPGNVGIYEALGFRVTGTYQIKGGPKFWSMWREPRAGAVSF